MPRIIVPSIVALLVTSSVALAQDSPVVVPGGRVRITEEGPDKTGRHAGTVVTAGRDTIALRPDRSEEAVPIARARITQVEVSQGRHGNALKGLGLGFLAGAGIGALVGSNSCSSCVYEDADKLLTTGAYAAVGAGAGMLLGGVIGATYKTERWEAVPMARWRLSAGPSRSGFALALSRSLDPQTR